MRLRLILNPEMSLTLIVVYMALLILRLVNSMTIIEQGLQLNSRMIGDNEICTSDYRWVILALTWFVYFSLGLILGSLPPLVNPISTDLAISYTQMGLVLGSGGLMYIGLSFPIGVIIDRFGLRRMISVGIILISFSSILRSIAFNFEALFFAVFIYGCGGPIISVGLAKVVACTFCSEERGLASGIYMTGIIVGSATALSITNSIVLPLVANWRLVFLLYGIIVIFILVIWFILGKGFEEAKKEESLATPLKQIFRKLISLKKVWLVAILTSAYFFSAYGLGQWLPTLLELGGMSSAEAGFISSLPSWTGILGCVVLPRYAKSGRRMPMIAGLILIQGLMVYSITITSGLILTFGLVILGICTHSVLPILITILMDIPEISSEYMGFASGVLFSIGCVFGVVSPLIVGYIADYTGSFVPSIVFLAVLIEFVLILTIIMKE